MNTIMGFPSLLTDEPTREYTERFLLNREHLEGQRGYLSLSVRYDLLKESNGACCLCGARGGEDVKLEIDHIKPWSLFPEYDTDPENLQVLCFDCNRGKSNRCTVDWRRRDD